MASVSDLAKLARAALPFFAAGEVVHGFGRGSKQLGCPTANFSDAVVENLPKELTCGVYCGFASIDNGPVYKMVMSIGWNPYFKNTKRTMETHILHAFDKDFYGGLLKVVITNYLRPMSDFKSMEELMAAIDSDIEQSKRTLTDKLFSQYAGHEFFAAPN